MTPMMVRTVDKLSTYSIEQHRRDWHNCQLCPLCTTRSQVVLVRGTLPCSLLLIGEAPGDSEDALGYPFVGPAGQLFDEMLFDAFEHVGQDTGFLVHIPYALTNIVACLPVQIDTLITDTGHEIVTGRSWREPSKQEAKACEPRLREIIAIANPKKICTLGLVAKRYLPKDIKIPVFHLTHPSAILRSGSGLERKRFVLNLAANLKDLL